jgi:hypothetical protein
MTAVAHAYREIDPVNALEEALWSISQQSRVLQHLRRDIRMVWEDEAARELNGRYLNPHETDDLSMREQMKEQVELVKQAHNQVTQAEEFGRQAEDFAKSVCERAQFARQDLDNAYSHYDLYVQYNSDARSKFPVIQQLINRANDACD